MKLDENRPTDVRSIADVEEEHKEKITGLRLMVVIGDEVISSGLPKKGVLSIGRLKDSDIQIPNSTVSRKHANLIIGKTIAIEDCGSLNGVSVRGQKLMSGEKVEFGLGEIVELGDAILVIQRRSIGRAPRELMSKEDFDRVLSETCNRAERTESSFGVMLVQVSSEVPGEAVEGSFDLCLRTHDILSFSEQGEYAGLVFDRSPETVEGLGRRFMELLDRFQTEVRLGIACYPRDALTCDLLVNKARAAMSGDQVAEDVGEIVLEDEQMQRLHRLIERIAPSNISVMIQGETGAGKEVLARLLHRYSRRPEHLFVGVNCAALPQSLLESELFGHERGAFTGATKAKPGLLEVVENGTFLLDEVSEMPPAVQAKLLRVLEERQAVRVGGLKPYSIDARFVATTNRKLEEAVQQGIFREDLYYRLEGILLIVPSLRERKEDVEPLARAFIREAGKKMGQRQEPVLTDEALDWLREQSWPGNVRELRNVMERALLFSTGGRITRECVATGTSISEGMSRSEILLQPPPLPGGMLDEHGQRPTDSAGGAVNQDDKFEALPTRTSLRPLTDRKSPKLKDEMKQLEYNRIVDALKRAGGNQTRASKLLGMSRRTLINRLDEYGIERPRKGKK